MQPLPALDVAWYARLLARLADDRRDFVLRRRPVRARASSDWRTAIMPGCTDSLASAHYYRSTDERRVGKERSASIRRRQNKEAADKGGGSAYFGLVD